MGLEGTERSSRRRTRRERIAQIHFLHVCADSKHSIPTLVISSSLNTVEPYTHSKKKKERNEWKKLPLFVPGCVRRFVNVRVCTLFLGVFFFSPSFRLLKNKMWRFLCHCRIWCSFFFLFFNNKSATFRLLLHEYEFSGTVHLRTKKCLFFTFFPRLEMNELPSSMTEEKKTLCTNDLYFSERFVDRYNIFGEWKNRLSHFLSLSLHASQLRVTLLAASPLWNACVRKSLMRFEAPFVFLIFFVCLNSKLDKTVTKLLAHGL